MTGIACRRGEQVGEVGARRRFLVHPNPLFTQLKSERNSGAMPNGHKDKVQVKPKALVRSKRQRQGEIQKGKGRSKSRKIEEDEESSQSERDEESSQSEQDEESSQSEQDEESSQSEDSPQIERKRKSGSSTKDKNVVQIKAKTKRQREDISGDDEGSKQSEKGTTKWGKEEEDTDNEAPDEPEVDVTESAVKLKNVNKTGPVKFGDLYQSEEDKTQYKFIRENESNPNIIYLTSGKNDFLYEYNTQTEKIKKHPSSKFHEMSTFLSEKYVKFAKNLLLGDSTSVDEEVEVNNEGLKVISESLNTYLKNSLKALQLEDDKEINLGPNSKYGRILKRSVQAILDKYGLEIDYVAAVKNDNGVRKGLNDVKLRHPTEKWEKNKKNDNRETAKLAAVHLMSNDQKAQQAIDIVKAKYHEKSSVSAIREAYASAICKNENGLTRGLAEARLRYTPITYKSDIYLAVKDDRYLKPEEKEEKEWELFNTLIHEALHSAEHPNFTSFLDEHIPPGLQEDIKEGIVDYLTNQIWIEVLKKVEVSTKRGQRITPSDQSSNKGLQITQEVKNKYNDKYFAYKDQVKMVMDLIENLTDGKKRLISAYFGGNPGAFLPKIEDT
jgi:hypothetical protein